MSCFLCNKGKDRRNKADIAASFQVEISIIQSETAKLSDFVVRALNKRSKTLKLKDCNNVIDGFVEGVMNIQYDI